jgi:hypothetical protein
MTREECEAKINALYEPDGLLGSMREGELDTRKLDELAQAVVTLNVLDLSAADRGRLAGMLWEFAFHVSNCIASHHNKADTFIFENVSDRQLRALNNMVYWLSNRFTYGKELETADLHFAGYMRWDGFDPSVPFDPSKTS